MRSKGVKTSQGEIGKERDRISEVRQKWVKEKSERHQKRAKGGEKCLEEDWQERKRRVGSTSNVIPKENHEDFATTLQRRPSGVSTSSDGFQYLSARAGG